MSLPKTIVHLLSGGMDSVVMLYDLVGKGHNVHSVLFNYHQKHVRELEWARHHCNRLGVKFTLLDLPQLRGSELTDGSGGVVVPNRNAIMLSLAVNLAIAAGAETVTYGCNADDEAVFPDCRMAFIQTFNNMLTTQEINVEVCAPYIDKKKWWIVGLGREMGINFDETWTCYSPDKKFIEQARCCIDVPCGKCAACLKRHKALHGFPQDECGCDGKY